MFKLKLSSDNPNTRERSEFVFQAGGHWEKNRGPNQTRAFAESAHRRFRIPWGEFSVLDVGCAMGDALPVWRAKYPSARLYGCDVADSAVERCRKRHGSLAEFFRASFEEIEGFWDVIYCSNVLEHFEQHREIAEWLLGRCKLLLILTPFGELRCGSRLKPRPDDYHVATFYRDSFDGVVESGKASRVETAVFSSPRAAWGFNGARRLLWLAGSILRNRYIVQEPLQILYALHSPLCPPGDFVRDEGRYPC